MGNSGRGRRKYGCCTSAAECGVPVLAEDRDKNRTILHCLMRSRVWGLHKTRIKDGPYTMLSVSAPDFGIKGCPW